MSRDLTAALEERRRSKPAKTITVYDDVFELPRALPASVALELADLDAQLKDEARQVGPVQLRAVGQAILGDQWDRFVSLFDLDEFDWAFTQLIDELMGQPDTGGGDRQGEASPAS